MVEIQKFLYRSVLFKADGFIGSRYLDNYKRRFKSETVEMAVENRDTLDNILWNVVLGVGDSLTSMISGGGKRGVHGDGMVDENSAGGAERGGQQA